MNASWGLLAQFHANILFCLADFKMLASFWNLFQNSLYNHCSLYFKFKKIKCKLHFINALMCVCLCLSVPVILIRRVIVIYLSMHSWCPSPVKSPGCIKSLLRKWTQRMGVQAHPRSQPIWAGRGQNLWERQRQSHPRAKKTKSTCNTHLSSTRFLKKLIVFSHNVHSHTIPSCLASHMSFSNSPVDGTLTLSC